MMSRTAPTPGTLPDPDWPDDPHRAIVPADQVWSYGAALRRYWWVIASAVLLAAIAALAVSLSSTKTYDATAKLLASNSEPIDIVTQTTGDRSLDPQRDLNTGIELVKLDSVAQAVRSQLRLSMGVSQLLNKVSASPEGNSNVIAIEVSDGSATRAAAIANAFAQQYLIFRRNSSRTLYLQAARAATDQYDSLSADQQQKPAGRELLRSADELQVASTVQTGATQLVNSAPVPTSPANPSAPLVIIVAVLVGLFIGAVCALGLDSRRRWR